MIKTGAKTFFVEKRGGNSSFHWSFFVSKEHFKVDVSKGFETIDYRIFYHHTKIY